MDKIYLDENGYKQYLSEIEDIRNKIDANNRDISEYMSDDAYGDSWHDNFAYEQAIQKENVLRRDLELKLKGLDKIVIISDKKESDDVSINSIVDILFDGEIDTETYTITGSTSSNIQDDIHSVTINSPFGKAIYHKKKNDRFTYKVDDNTITGTIIDIRN